MHGVVGGGGDAVVADGNTVGVADEDAGLAGAALDNIILNDNIINTTAFSLI